MHMFFGIPQRYVVDIYGFYFEEYILGYLLLCEQAQMSEDGVLAEYLLSEPLFLMVCNLLISFIKGVRWWSSHLVKSL